MRGWHGSVLGRAPLGALVSGRRSYRSADRAEVRYPLSHERAAQQERCGGNLRSRAAASHALCTDQDARSTVAPDGASCAPRLCRATHRDTQPHPGLLAEFGIVLPLKAATVRRRAGECLEELPGWANTVIGDLLSEVGRLDERIAQYDQHLRHIARQDSRAQRLTRLSGIGDTTATCLVAMIGNGHDFECGRQFAAWLGRVPGQYSSGGKARLGRITKAGDPYLRSLLVMGARAVLAAAKNKTDTLSRWAMALQQRRGYWKAVVAIAAKNARMAWAVLRRGEAFVLPA